MLHAPTPRQAAVMTILARGEARPGEIAAELGWPVTRVSALLGELRRVGLARRVGPDGGGVRWVAVS